MNDQKMGAGRGAWPRVKPHLGAALCLTVVAVFFAGAAQAQELDKAAVDTAVERIRAEVGIPGVALAVVRGDSVVHLRGYGVREAGGGDPVGPGTLLAIGSATKAFTATLVGMMRDEGRLAWDDRVVDRLPGFALSDPYPTATITIRDLLAHRSGLPTANLMWLPTSHPPDTLIRRLRHLESVSELRSTFTYQNVLYLAAGEVLRHASGRRWEALLEERILEPLDMRDTNASVSDLSGQPEVAVPHVRVDGQAVPVPYRNADDVAPAGSINSSARDLARWLGFLVAEGETPDGARLIEASTLRETWTPQTVVGSDPVTRAFHPAARLQAYGMGWFLSDFHGRTLVAHGGGIDGMSTLVAWVPEEELGVAILTNLQTPAPAWIYGILYAVLDPALGVEPTPWEPPYRELESLLAQLTDGPMPQRVEGTRPSLPPDAYVGPYSAPTLGEVRLARDQEGGLMLQYGSLVGVLEHWHFDTFRVTWRDIAFHAVAGPGWIDFRLDRSGAVEGMTLEVFPGDRTWLEGRSDGGDPRSARSGAERRGPGPDGLADRFRSKGEGEMTMELLLSVLDEEPGEAEEVGVGLEPLKPCPGRTGTRMVSWACAQLDLAAGSSGVPVTSGFGRSPHLSIVLIVGVVSRASSRHCDSARYVL